MSDPAVERGTCRFKAVAGEQRQPSIRLEMFHQTISAFKNTTIEFELLRGTTQEQAKALADAMNDRILGIVVRSS